MNFFFNLKIFEFTKIKSTVYIIVEQCTNIRKQLYRRYKKSEHTGKKKTYTKVYKK